MAVVVEPVCVVIVVGGSHKSKALKTRFATYEYCTTLFHFIINIIYILLLPFPTCCRARSKDAESYSFICGVLGGVQLKWLFDQLKYLCYGTAVTVWLLERQLHRNRRTYKRDLQKLLSDTLSRCC